MFWGDGSVIERGNCPIFNKNFHKLDPATNHVAVNLMPKESNDFHVLFRMVGGNYNLTPQEIEELTP